MQVVLQDRFHRTVGQRTDLGGTFAGRLDGLLPMRADKPDNAEAGAEALFRVGLGMQDLLHQRSGVRANPLHDRPTTRIPAGTPNRSDAPEQVIGSNRNH